MRVLYSELLNTVKDKKLVKSLFIGVRNCYKTQIAESKSPIIARDETVDRYKLDPSAFHWRSTKQLRQSPRP